MKQKVISIILSFFFFFFCCCCCLFSPSGSAQTPKRPIDNVTYKEWESLGNYGLSNNGKFAWFQHYFHKDGKNVTILCSTETEYRQEFAGGGAVFTPDSRYFLINSKDGILVTNTITKAAFNIDSAKNLVVIAEGNGHTISYTIGRDLIIHDLSTNHKRKYTGHTRSWLNADASQLLIQQDSLLILVHVKTDKRKIIWTHGKIGHVCMSKKSDQIVFSIYHTGDIQYYHYNSSQSKLDILFNNANVGIRKGYCISDEPPEFSENEKRLFFKLKRTPKAVHVDNSVINTDVNIWSYQDKHPPSYQLQNTESNRRFTAVIPVSGGPIIQIETLDSTLCVPLSNKYAIVKKNSNVDEIHWNKKEAFGVSLISLNDGKHLPLAMSYTEYFNTQLSPCENFVLWWDGLTSDWYCYNIITRVTTNVTKSLAQKGSVEPSEEFGSLKYIPGGWLKNDRGLLMYDPYDIWLIDLKSWRRLNVTGGYGRLHKIKLRAAITEKDISQLNETDSLLITGLCNSTRYNGFLKTSLANDEMPVKKSMDPLVYYYPGIFLPPPPLPQKAKMADIFILTRQSCEESPNVVVTTDFTTFRPLSDIKPQANWNWLQSELLTWKTLDGKLCKGILYKPENFDSTKTYPIIFHYYELPSNECFKALTPGLSQGDLNIPWYVSNGYIVFVPDIVKIKGKPGWSALNAVVSAANYLTDKFPWINKSKMGLQGHSYGAYETNYIIAHSHHFIAAQSSSGICNFISSWGQIFGLHEQNPNIYETGQYQIGSTPWQNPEVYIENSPVFSVDSITTPLLLLHNKADFAVPFEQAIEFYTALRRLNKPVWLLQYDTQGHVMDGFSGSSLDFTIRQQQFFNYYLKDGPLPAWMGKQQL